MGLMFFESMRGELRDRWGRPRAIEFTLRAESTDTLRFLRDGRMRVSGMLKAPPWISDAPIDGSLRVGLPRDRRIDYELQCRGDDGREFRLSGGKTVDLVHFVYSMTHMPAELRVGGELVACGELRFDLNEVLAYFASWTLSTSTPALALHQTQSGGAGFVHVLTRREEAVLWALGEALLLEGEVVPAFGRPTQEGCRQALARLSAFSVTLYRLALLWLDAQALLHCALPFALLSLARRRALVQHLASGEAWAWEGRLIQLLGMPLKAAHFDRADYLEPLGYPSHPPIAPEPPPRYMAQVTSAEALAGETEIEAEVVVIGTGAGGAVVAAELAERGIAVAVVEEGPFLHRDAFQSSPLERSRRYWRQGGLTLTLGAPPISVPLGRAVGGTTVINSGTCFPAPDAVLRSWCEDLGFPEDFQPDRFRPYYDKVARDLGVEPGRREYLGHIADVVARGADAMGLAHGPLPRNAPDCDGQGECIFGCPTGAKRATEIAYMPRALARGAMLFTGLPVTRLLVRGRRTWGIEARGTDAFGAPHILRIRADRVVVACGALGTPALLQTNGVRHPWLGRNLSLHPALGMWGRFREPMDPWHAIPQGYGVEALVEEGLRYEGFYLPPQLMGGMLPLVGEALRDWMDAHRFIGQYGFMVRDAGSGRVIAGPEGVPQAFYWLSDESVRRLRLGAALLAELLFHGGAQAVLTGIDRVPELHSIDEARRLSTAPLRANDFNLLGAHPLGTCRMARAEAHGVVDFDHRVFGMENLYVIDGSAVPTSLGANPHMTIMAMAIRAAERMAAG